MEGLSRTFGCRRSRFTLTCGPGGPGGPCSPSCPSSPSFPFLPALPGMPFGPRSPWEVRYKPTQHQSTSYGNLKTSYPHIHTNKMIQHSALNVSFQKEKKQLWQIFIVNDYSVTVQEALIINFRLRPKRERGRKRSCRGTSVGIYLKAVVLERD